MDKVLICGIYKITSPTNRIYIGQSRNVLHRFSVYKSVRCKGQVKLYHSFLKYGVDRHKFEIIHVCEPHELNDLEVYYIQLFNTFNSKYGLNLRSGGKHNTLSKESIEKMRRASLGNQYRKGKPRSFEERKQISSTMTGRKYDPVRIAKMRIGKLLSDNTDRMPVLQLSKSGDTIQKWQSITCASESLSIDHSSISKVCRHKRKTAGGFKWIPA